MSKEEIIEEYIEYIRNISEADDEEIRSAINRLTEEDSESLEVLEKFLSKIKTVPIDIKIEIEDKKAGTKRNERTDLLDIFDDYDYAYPLEDLMSGLRESGYSNPGRIIVDAIQDNFLYLDSIEDDGTAYFALTDTEKEE